MCECVRGRRETWVGVHEMASSLHRRAAINLMFCASVLGAVVVRESPLQLKSLLFHSRISTDTCVRRRTTFVGRGISGGDLRTGGVLAAAASSPSSSFSSSSAASAPGKIVTICGEYREFHCCALLSALCGVTTLDEVARIYGTINMIMQQRSSSAAVHHRLGLLFVPSHDGHYHRCYRRADIVWSTSAH